MNGGQAVRGWSLDVVAPVKHELFQSSRDDDDRFVVFKQN